MKTFLTDDDIELWGAWRANYVTFGPYGYFLLDIGKDKAILSLFKQLNNKKKAPKCCYNIQYQQCAVYYELHTARHCDYAAVYLAHIIKVPYIFKENPTEDDQEIANLIPKIQAYCAERGIKLE